MADVFVSYARPDEAAAARVARELCKIGLSVWYDTDLPAHRPYSDVIEQELETARSVLVLWSKDAVESQWVRSEANRARELGKLVQGRLEDVRPPMPFDQIQCADLSTWRRGGSQVQRSIAAILGGDGATPAPRAKSKVGRRGVVLGGGAAAIAATAGGSLWLLGRERSGPAISPATAALIQQAKGALWQNTPEGQNQAIGIYRQVATDNPELAEAWGRLSMAYALTSHWRRQTEAASLRERARSAAERALSLNAKDVHALIGIAFAKPFIGNWSDATGTLRRALSYDPKDGETDFSLAMILAMSGFIREALDHIDLILHDGPTPGIYVWSAQMLWSAGRGDELDARLDEATKLYPTHFGVWFTRFYTDMMGGRPEVALAFAGNTSTRPTGISPDEIDAVVRVARAIQSPSAARTQAIVNEWMARARHGAGYAENAAQFMSSLGRVEEAFAVLRAYFFGEGFDPGENRFNGTLGAFTARNDRQTEFLFFPSMAHVRADPRFALLVKDLKLSDYWRASRRRPEYLATSTY